VQYEARSTGGSSILAALQAAPLDDPGAADVAQVAHVMGALASSQRTASELIERMATDIADGYFSSEEARRLVPMVESAAGAAQDKCHALDALVRAIRIRLTAGR
jgi:hypothetical protein